MLPETYDYYLVLASYVVAAIASFVALGLAGRVASSSGNAARWWLIGGGCAMGIGIWSMHFIGMLAFQLPIPLGYDFFKTFLSLVVACIASGFALWLATRAALPPIRLALGALLMGGGIATMHYTGMAAMEMQPAIVYDPFWFGASVAVAIATAGAALWIAFTLREDRGNVWRMRLAAAMVMGLAVAGMHYTGMAAANFPLDSLCGAAGSDGIQTGWLATLVSVAALGILGIAFVIAVLDRRLEERTSLLAASLEKAEHDLIFLALHDNLTKLPNRVLLDDRLDQAIQKNERAGSRFALMFMDLDGFKAVNDMYGHPIGDRLLHEVGERIAGAIRAQDTVARIGGDEFVLLMDIAEPTDAATVAEKILDAVHRDFSIEKAHIRVSGSIGIAIYPDDGRQSRELLTNADAAMYYAKDHGRNTFRFFEASMNAGAHEQLALLQDLRHAIERDELRLHYQPKYSAPRGPMTGAEALLRWEHPTRGLIEPQRFIGLAEKSGLIIEIGAWVLDEACRQIRAWRDSGFDIPGVAVNLSAMQFGESGLFERVREALARHGVDSGSLTLEITESTAMKDPELSLVILQRLVDFGVQISIDDFGTGYSSLLYLKRLPASELKIDRGFIRDLTKGTEDEAIVSVIIALGKTLNIRIVAEGVETESQAGILTGLGCDSLQGFLLCTPMPPDLFVERSRHSRRLSHAMV